MMNMYSKYDNMQINYIKHAKKCRHNYVISCISCMLSKSSEINFHLYAPIPVSNQIHDESFHLNPMLANIIESLRICFLMIYLTLYLYLETFNIIEI